MKGTLLKDFGGKDRYLRYDANAWADMGDKLGLTIRIGHIQEDLMDAPLPLSAVRVLIWGGLIHAEPELTERDVGSWIDEDNMMDVLQVFFSRFSATSPDLESALRDRLEMPAVTEGATEEAVAATS